MSIPHTFHAVWVGSPIPDQAQRFLATWLEHHPDWELRIWTDEQLEAFPLLNRQVYVEAQQIAPREWGQLRADVARYEILLEHGGVYVDTDMECLHSIEELVRGVSCFAGWEAPGRWVNNAVLGADPGHPFLRALVDGLAENVRRHADPDRIRPNVLSGPQYLTPIYQRYKDQVTVYPKVFFYPYLWNELGRGRDEFPHSYAVHHWANARRKKGVPL